MDVVLRLRELRRLRGLTQVEVAQRARLGPKTLSSFESGARVDAMKVTQLLRLLAIYGVTPATFFDETRAVDDFSASDPRVDARATIRSLDACPPNVRAPAIALIAAVAAQLGDPNQRERRESASSSLRVTRRTA